MGVLVSAHIVTNTLYKLICYVYTKYGQHSWENKNNCNIMREKKKEMKNYSKKYNLLFSKDVIG